MIDVRTHKAVASVPDRVHPTYVVRDAEAVWTGSVNWTDDSCPRMGRERQRLLEAPALAANVDGIRALYRDVRLKEEP